MSALSRRVSNALGADAVLVAAGGGASRAGFVVHERGGSAVPLAFLRVDDGTSGMSGSSYDLGREAALLRRLGDAGLRVPAVLATFDDPPATLLEFVPGANVVAGDHLESVAAEYMALLAEIHVLDPSIASTVVPPTTAEAVAIDLAWWQDHSSRSGADDDPLLRLAAPVLQSTRPEVDEAPAFLHGDAGPGNFLVDGSIVTALLDWEMAHVGDPHEDLAWVQIRMVHSPFGSFERRLEEYATASGRPVVPERLEWNAALVLMKTVVALTATLRRPSDGRVLVPQFGMLLAYRALLASALIRLRGGDGTLLARTPVPDDVPSSRLIEQLAHLAPDAPREHRIIAEYLLERERMAAWAVGERRRSETDELDVALEALVVDADLALYPHRHAVRWVRAAQESGLGR